MANLFEKLRQLIFARTAAIQATAVPVGGDPLSLNNEIVKRLMRQVEETQADQYSCDETFALLDEYVELVASDEEAAALMPLVEHHLHACPDCCERFETLLRILRTES